LVYGVEQHLMEGLNITVSDIERTLLDGLDHPRIFGSIARSLDLLTTQLPKVSVPRLIEHAAKGSTPNTCQRLGVLLERERVSQRRIDPLEMKARQTRSLLSMNPDAKRVGPTNRRWNVVENDL
jgi:predicted transcriptional regulator of viral defense system